MLQKNKIQNNFNWSSKLGKNGSDFIHKSHFLNFFYREDKNYYQTPEQSPNGARGANFNLSDPAQQPVQLWRKILSLMTKPQNPRLTKAILKHWEDSIH